MKSFLTARRTLSQSVSKSAILTVSLNNSATAISVSDTTGFYPHVLCVFFVAECACFLMKYWPFDDITRRGIGREVCCDLR